ncbi:uncharacterized protein LOC117178825 isoform X2 [Belonocnema kinseyi]|uniref:uncharacterized protein LOC117178825 isoform X2 n=1 Tax=Belonocnema kinseyi TaxID=2817044 RepID=UPI00143D8654|nr:uncharacterized protein LOC117178825 isoform X2 [Belonocnema kinseyi]
MLYVFSTALVVLNSIELSSQGGTNQKGYSYNRLLKSASTRSSSSSTSGPSSETLHGASPGFVQVNLEDGSVYYGLMQSVATRSRSVYEHKRVPFSGYTVCLQIPPQPDVGVEFYYVPDYLAEVVVAPPKHNPTGHLPKVAMELQINIMQHCINQM